MPFKPIFYSIFEKKIVVLFLDVIKIRIKNEIIDKTRAYTLKNSDSIKEAAMWIHMTKLI